MSKRVAFVGLGVMGFPMAGHLSQAGHNVTVFNRTAATAERWVGQYGGARADSPADASHNAEFVFVCVGNDDDVESVVRGHHGIFDSLQQDAVLIDHSTVSASLARRLAHLTMDRDAWFIDAPISGGQAGAENGTLTVMAGGDALAWERAEPVIAAFSSYKRLLGPAGSGQMAKMVNQVCIAGLLQALAEGLHFAEMAGLDAEAVVDVISRGAAASWQMSNRSQTMLAGHFDFGFAIDWMRKDLGIALDEARRSGARMPVTALVDQFYGQLQANGLGRADTSALIDLLRAQDDQA
ncbi:MAG: NAD(P)-dependent oxidoreductase [Gammaproteobacteria bacterium]|nr:NAD(P)-dependent oxidoreductase [Gammaproteobacteria bacterium]